MKWKLTLITILTISSSCSVIPIYFLHNNHQTYNKLTSVETNNYLIKQDNSDLSVTNLINLTGSVIPIFNIRNLQNIYDELNLTSYQVTAEVAKNIIIRNQESFFGKTLNGVSFDRLLDNNSLQVINGDVNVYVSFTLKNVVINNNGDRGNKEFNLIMNGFRIVNSNSYMIVFIGIASIVAVILTSAIMYYVVKYLKRTKKKAKIIDGELIIDNY